MDYNIYAKISEATYQISGIEVTPSDANVYGRDPEMVDIASILESYGHDIDDYNVLSKIMSEDYWYIINGTLYKFDLSDFNQQVEYNNLINE